MKKRVKMGSVAAYRRVEVMIMNKTIWVRLRADKSLVRGLRTIVACLMEAKETRPMIKSRLLTASRLRDSKIVRRF